jgi:hypothetical protein
MRSKMSIVASEISFNRKVEKGALVGREWTAENQY